MKRKRKLLSPQKRAKVVLDPSLPALPQLSATGALLRPEETDRFQEIKRQKTTEPRERFVILTGLALSQKIRRYCHNENINLSYTDFFNAAAKAYLKSRGA